MHLSNGELKKIKKKNNLDMNEQKTKMKFYFFIFALKKKKTRKNFHLIFIVGEWLGIRGKDEEHCKKKKI